MTPHIWVTKVGMLLLQKRSWKPKASTVYPLVPNKRPHIMMRTWAVSAYSNVLQHTNTSSDLTFVVLWYFNIFSHVHTIHFWCHYCVVFKAYYVVQEWLRNKTGTALKVRTHTLKVLLQIAQRSLWAVSDIIDAFMNKKTGDHQPRLQAPPRFYLTAVEKSLRRPGIKTTSQTGNGGLGQYIM